MKKVAIVLFSTFLIALNSGCKKEPISDPEGTLTIITNYTLSGADWASISLYKGANLGASAPYVWVRCGMYDASLSLRFLTQTSDNSGFVGASYNLGQGGEVVNLGEVKGLGDVVNKPTSGWAETTAMELGNGYVLRVRQSDNYYDTTTPLVYYRLYVEEYITSVSGGILGVKVKYQGPF
jgi:hypothetical protein